MIPIMIDIKPKHLYVDNSKKKTTYGPISAPRPKQLVWIINQKLYLSFSKVFSRHMIKLISKIQYPMDPIKIDAFCKGKESVCEKIIHVMPINPFDRPMMPCKFNCEL